MSIAGVSVGRQTLRATLAGAAGALLGAAFGLLPASFVSIAAAIALLSAAFFCQSAKSVKEAAFVGFCFGWAWFGVALHWLYFSIHDYGHLPAVLAIAAVAAFTAFLALFPTAVFVLTSLFEAKRRIFSLAFLWVLSEWVREHLLTGFPWASPGYAFIDTPLAGLAPFIGHLGIFLVAMVIAAVLIAAWQEEKKGKRFLWVACAAVIVLAGYAAGDKTFGRPFGEVSMTIIEPDFPVVGSPIARRAAVRDYLARDLAGDVIVFPESTYFDIFERMPAQERAFLDQWVKTRQKTIVFNAFSTNDAGAFTNTVFAIGPEGLARYDKKHLVPFGEFVPTGFHAFVAALSIPMTDLAHGDRPREMVIGGQLFSLSLCYENLFPDDWFEDTHASGALLNLTNLKWFHSEAAVASHVAISRMRAIESARPLVYAANHAGTCVIDEKGEVIAKLSAPGILEARLKTRLTEPTPFMRLGYLPTLLLSVLALGALALRRRRYN